MSETTQGRKWLTRHHDRDDYDLSTAQDALDDAYQVIEDLLPFAAEQSASLLAEIAQLKADLDKVQAALARVKTLCDEATRHRDALPASTFGGGKFPALINARDVLAALSPAAQRDARD